MTKQVYDLEERTYQFTKRVRFYTINLPKNIANIKVNYMTKPFN